MLVQVSDLHFSYAGENLFTALTLQINAGERVGLVGPNGSGKSTLLRLLDGRLDPESGQIARARGVRMAYLRQSQEFEGDDSVLTALTRPFFKLLALREELASLEKAMAEKHPSEAILARYGTVLDEVERHHGYSLESRIRSLTQTLGFTELDLERPVGTLSGGERGRLELTKTLLEESDLLLLDEPTNHLDLKTTERLEERLANWESAFVIVSHDRYFLRATCQKIIEIEGGSASIYTGNYDRYIEERQVRYAQRHRAFEEQQEYIEKTEDFIRRNIAGQNTKQAQARQKALAKIERLSKPYDEFAAAGALGIEFLTGDELGGKEVLKLKKLAIGYSEPALQTGPDLTVYRGDRIGIVGPNGTGKSTLLRTLLEQIPPLRGHARWGFNLTLGYFDQNLGGLDENNNLIEEIRRIRGDFNTDIARSFLGRFRFSGDEVFRKVRALSGGERNRLTLAKLMLEPRNVLILDEPTNHLDIPAREALERALRKYKGTVIAVSHDRYFLDQIATQMLVFGEHDWELHAGNYSAYHDRLALAKPAEKEAVNKVATQQFKSAPRPPPPAQQDRQRRRSLDRDLRRKQRKLESLEKEIAALEAELKTVQAELLIDHGSQWDKLHTLVERQEQIQEDLQDRIAAWEQLSAELG